MSIRFRTHILARTLGATLLLSTALTAWGVSIILTGDAGGTVSCTTSLVTVTDGNVTANVPTACIPAGGTGGGTGPFTLSVVKTGPTAATGTVASDVGGISCGTTCTSAAQTSGTEVTLSATAGALAGWSGGGCSGTGTCPVTLTSNTTVTAIFGPLNLTVTKAGGGLGAVTSTGINCGDGTPGDCTEAYPTVTSVLLTAAPGTGATFAGWSGGGCSGTALTCAVNMNDSKAVTATFNAAGACGPLPPDVTVVDTGSISTTWPQQIFLPLPAQITAFKVTVPAGFSQKGNFTATKTSAASKSKLLVVSTCPGVLEPVGGQSSCVVYSLESSLLRMTGNAAASSYYCKLTPGNTYYVNAVSKTKLTDTVLSCTSTTNCSFYASRSAPY